jgi:hypothetical protein
MSHVMEWSVLSLLPDTLQSDIKDMGGRRGTYFMPSTLFLGSLLGFEIMEQK